MKAKNETFQRFLLAIRKQGQNETVDQYKQALEIQAKNCTFSALSVGKHQEECLRDAFVRGIIRQFSSRTQETQISAAAFLNVFDTCARRTPHSILLVWFAALFNV